MGNRSIRWGVGRAIDAAVWRPSRATLIRDQLVGLERNERWGYSDRDHLAAAAEWLARAQDVTPDGGVSGRYSLRKGWSSSYPETTGYIIPTFLALGRALNPRFYGRAERCVEFLEGLQFHNGAFPAGELRENRSLPSVFNTAQILHGLVAWHAETGDAKAAAAATRAAEWMVAEQEADGAWRRHIYNDVTTYTAHASCWLAEAGLHFGVTAWTQSAERHLDWVLSHVDRDTGWIDRAGFGNEDHRGRRAVTHTLAYTIWGVLHLSQSLGRNDATGVARAAADRVARRLELSGWLPGEINGQWKASRSDYACLTGNLQMALIWLRLARLDGDMRFVNAALKAIDLVKAAQPMTSSDPGIRGGIPGSAPIWGDYLYMALPNWAAKYFVDALLAKRDTIASIAVRQTPSWNVPDDVPRGIPVVRAWAMSVPRVVMLSSPDSDKVPQMIRAWSSWGFRPAAVILEERDQPRASVRIARRLRNDGFAETVRSALLQRLRRRASSAREGIAPVDVTAFCHAEGIHVVRVADLSRATSVAVLRELAPDLLVHAGAGILRRELLESPRLGTLNAHMGILPRYRGMNVAEWARLEENPVGCTVHLVHQGIDTGDILVVQEADTTGARSVSELRDVVDRAQIALLGQVLRFVVETGSLPHPRAQSADEGRQYFRMHPELKAALEAKLALKPKRDVTRKPSPILQTLVGVGAT